MKKYLYGFLICLLSVFAFSFSSNESEGETAYYAKVQNDSTLFYAQPNENSGLFVVPESYFVKIVGQQDDFYIAQYKDLQGYVKMDMVTPMNGSPLVPYYIENFRAFYPDGLGLYTKPQMDETLKMLTIPYLYENLVFYGSISGNSIPEKSNLWHYCKYENSEYGYVYSVFCDKLSSPPENHEVFEVVSTPSFEIRNKISPISSTAMAFIIIGVSLPCLIVLYLLVKPNIVREKLPKEKRNFRARKKRDYFEFDDADLT